MRVADWECFVIAHSLSPRTGPSIAYSTEHAYIVVRLEGKDGHVGWGETYRTPGTLAAVAAICESVVGRDDSLRNHLREVTWVGGGLSGGGFAPSAVALALEDLAARELGISVAAMYGGPDRRRVRAYAASGGYVEGRDPADTWPRELEHALDAGFTALKVRVGRHPISHEARLLERLRSTAPPGFELMADGNAAYTLPEAITMGRILHDLDFRWFEEPMDQLGGYIAYERLVEALDIAIAGGECSLSRADANRLLQRRAVDVIQPDPVIVGGMGNVMFIADLAALHGVWTIPHCSNSAIGIAASLQTIANMPETTRSPSAPDPVLEYGIDENPNREALLARPLDLFDGWVEVPTGAGIGVEIDEPYVRANAVEHLTMAELR